MKEYGCSRGVANWIRENIDFLLASCPFVCQKERDEIGEFIIDYNSCFPVKCSHCKLDIKAELGRITATALDVISSNTEVSDDGKPNVVCDFNYSDTQTLEIGHYNIVFVHPESVVSCVYGRKLLQSKLYQDNVCAVVVDEASAF